MIQYVTLTVYLYVRLSNLFVCHAINWSPYPSIFLSVSHTCLSVVPEIRPRMGSVFWDDGRTTSVDDLLSP